MYVYAYVFVCMQKNTYCVCMHVGVQVYYTFVCTYKSHQESTLTVWSFYSTKNTHDVFTCVPECGLCVRESKRDAYQCAHMHAD